MHSECCTRDGGDDVDDDDGDGDDDDADDGGDDDDDWHLAWHSECYSDGENLESITVSSFCVCHTSQYNSETVTLSMIPRRVRILLMLMMMKITQNIQIT